jgi:DNA-binding NarL/FixJ family response regulator
MKKEVSDLDVLTPREQEICRLLAYGHTNSEIAEKLYISNRTVQSHRRNIMSKLNLTGRAEIVSFAIDHGLFAPSS